METDRVMRPCLAALSLLVLLSACGGGDAETAPEEAQRLALADVRRAADDPAPSPNTTDALWTVTQDGQALDFGRPDGDPLLSLGCRLRDDPPQVTITRHVGARPGQRALFPVIGNGTISRFPVDASLENGAWRWQGVFAADDARLDVFTGPREIEATLPGGGTVLMAGSRVPGEFIRWCRARGRLQDALAREAAEVEPPAAPAPAAR